MEADVVSQDIEIMKSGAVVSTIRLHQIAVARSGDKGNHANIGVIARSEAAYQHLVKHLTASTVAEFFAAAETTLVERFELRNIWGLNFVLYNSLAGGASLSLRIDTQGKLMGTAILELELPAPTDLASMLQVDSKP